MPDALLFDGVDDEIRLTLGEAVISAAGITVAAIVNLTADGPTWKSLVAAHNSLGQAEWAFEIGYATGGELVFDVRGGPYLSDAAGLALAVSDGWCLVAVTKASGAVAPRYHRWRYSDSSALHGNGDLTVANGLAPDVDGEYRLGKYETTDPLDGNLLIAAVWANVLADGQIEALRTGKQAWIDAAPLECWRLDTPSEIASSAVGGSSTETARTGTTLDADDAPDGWADTLGAAPGDPPVATAQKEMSGRSFY